MSDKFILEYAGNLLADTVVIARADHESMHGTHYMVVNGDKPYSAEVYHLLKKHGIKIELFEKMYPYELQKCCGNCRYSQVDEGIELYCTHQSFSGNEFLPQVEAFTEFHCSFHEIDNTLKIIENLKRNGYDGLAADTGECDCNFADNFPCGYNCLVSGQCQPAYEHSNGKYYTHKEDTSAVPSDQKGVAE